MACGAQILDQANAGASESRDASRPRAARKAEPNRMALRDFVERPWARLNIRGAADVPETN